MTESSIITGDIAIVGTGNMGGAILAGLIQAGAHAGQIRIVDPALAGTLSEQYGVAQSPDANEAASGAAVVLIAVKPPRVRDVVTCLADRLDPDALLISIAAGIGTGDLETWAATPANPKPAVVRATPNTPAKLRQGVTALSPGAFVSPAQLDVARAIFGAVGTVVTIDESLMAATSAVSGCGPAYLFLVAEAMTEAGVRLGLPRDTAIQLVTSTFVGSSALLATGGSPTELRAQVTSPGGTTAAAIYELENRGLRAALSAAMAATVQRSAELG